MSRRDASDKKWQDVKKKVRTRDKGTDRILRVLSAKEAIILMRVANQAQLSILDPAHIFPVSVYPHLTYCEDNIVLLNRYSHENLDSIRDPVTGINITHEDAYEWWRRIAGPEQWDRLQNQLNPPSLDSN